MLQRERGREHYSQSGHQSTSFRAWEASPRTHPAHLQQMTKDLNRIHVHRRAGIAVSICLNAQNKIETRFTHTQETKQNPTNENTVHPSGNQSAAIMWLKLVRKFTTRKADNPHIKQWTDAKGPRTYSEPVEGRRMRFYKGKMLFRLKPGVLV